MKPFFDSSALVPIFDENHPHHARSVERSRQFDRSTGSCGAHSLIEVYSTVTRMPPKLRLSADQALLFIDSIRERFSMIALTNAEYITGLRDAANLGIVGGNIYDALLALCALKSGAAIVYTWNTRHFSQFGPEITSKLRTP